MDEYVSRQLRELEVRRAVVKNEIAIQRNKLNRQKDKVMSEIEYYAEMEKSIELLYVEDETLADIIIKFKLRNDLI